MQTQINPIVIYDKVLEKMPKVFSGKSFNIELRKLGFYDRHIFESNTRINFLKKNCYQQGRSFIKKTNQIEIIAKDLVLNDFEKEIEYATYLVKKGWKCQQPIRTIEFKEFEI